MAKFIVFDFRCGDCNLVFEKYVKPDIESSPCPECQGESRRLISAPRLDPRMGVDPDFATMADKWAKMRQKRAITDKAHYKEHGTDRTPGADTAG